MARCQQLGRDMEIDLISAQVKSMRIPVSTTASASTPLPNFGGSLRVVNEGDVSAYFAVAPGVATAVLPSGAAQWGCIVVLPGQDTVFSIPADDVLNISAICASGTTSLVVSVGNGA